MDSYMDIIKLQLLSNPGKSRKKLFRNILLLYLFTNFPKVTEWLWKKFYQHLQCRRVRHRNQVRLSFEKEVCDNTVFYEILKKHSGDFDIVLLKDCYNFHAVDFTKTVTIGDDIFLSLRYLPPPQPVSDTRKNNGVSSGNHDTNNVNEDGNSGICALKDIVGTVFSTTKTTKEILDFIHQHYKKDWQLIQLPAVHNEEVGQEVNIYVINGYDYKTNRMICRHTKCKFTKTFDNLFIEDDVYDQLKAQLDRFNDVQWHEYTGNARTFGALLHGKPGNGKTSLIKAICNEYGRDVVMIDFAYLKNDKMLEKVFSGYYMVEADSSSEMKSVTIPIDKVVFTFEDFHQMENNLFLERDTQRQQSAVEELERVRRLFDAARYMQSKQRKAFKLKNKSKLKSKPKSKSKSETKKDCETTAACEDTCDEYSSDEDFSIEKDEPGFKLTFSQFLQFLDGLEQRDGMMIILTTNERQQYDSAAIREGRIDLDIELKNASKDLICRIFCRFYAHKPKERLCQIWNSSHHKVVSQAIPVVSVVNAFSRLEPEDGMADLVRKMPLDGLEEPNPEDKLEMYLSDVSNHLNRESLPKDDIEFPNIGSYFIKKPHKISCIIKDFEQDYSASLFSRNHFFVRVRHSRHLTFTFKQNLICPKRIKLISDDYMDCSFVIEASIDGVVWNNLCKDIWADQLISVNDENKRYRHLQIRVISGCLDVICIQLYGNVYQ